MFVFCGLGNPGEKYVFNRHNVGFLAAETIHRRHGFGPWKSKFQAEISEGRLGNVKTLLIKPQTYMNKSGDALAALVKFYKLTPADILVAYDELDLPPGKTRLKVGGGHGGHNGIRSISQHLGPDFRRLRIGIGHPGSKDAVTPWVLGDFSKAEREWMGPLLEAISDNAPLLATGDDATFSNKIHLSTSDLLPDVPARGGKPKKARDGEAVEKAKKSANKGSATRELEEEPPKNAMAATLRQLLQRKTRG